MPKEVAAKADYEYYPKGLQVTGAVPCRLAEDSLFWSFSAQPRRTIEDEKGSKQKYSTNKVPLLEGSE